VNGDDALAFQVVGDGPVDLVYMQGLLSNVILNWEHPAHEWTRQRRLADGHRVELI
jgi:hypothetical protein